ncbi:unnamed protein product [Malus baccata var. baccata]
MVSAYFWNGVSLCLRVFELLFKVLQLVDGDKKPSMRFLYGELQKARNEIKEALKNNEAHYRPIIQIIDEKAHDQLDGPLHLAAYFLNPCYFFKDQSIQHDSLVTDAMFTCVEKFFLDNFEVQNRVINIEMLKYKRKEGRFGRHLVEIRCVENDDNYDLEIELGLGMDGETLKVDSSLEPRRNSRNVEDEDMEEGDDEEEIEFEPDTERVLEGYGEEEIEA